METTDDLIGIKIADAVAKSYDGKISQQNSSIEHDKEMPKERCISSENRQKITDDLRLI